MKKSILPLLALLIICSLTFAFSSSSKDQGKEPWTKEQLMEPADLAKIINDGKEEEIHIFDIGPAGQIKGAVQIGAAQDAENLEKLKQEINSLPKDANIIIYCGCCPFQHCPNIRPAFNLLNELHFSNAKLLNLPHNLKADWIDKGYPMEE